MRDVEDVVKDSWDKYSSEYDKCIISGEKHWKNYFYPRISKINVKDKEILDIGCGNGHIVRILKDYKRYVGIDLSEKLIEIARKRFGDRGEFYVMDAGALEFDDESFDIVFCLMVIHNAPNFEDLVKGGFRVLRRNGLFVVIENHPCFNPPNRERLDKDTTVIKEYRKEGVYKHRMNSTIPYFHRTLQTILNEFSKYGKLEKFGEIYEDNRTISNFIFMIWRKC